VSNGHSTLLQPVHAAGAQLFEDTFRHQMSSDGSMAIQDNLFKGKFGSGKGEWPVEPGRYRLLWMPACPHAHKVVITRSLLGLDAVISLGATGLMRDREGWVFTDDPGEKDPVLGIHYLKEIYTRTKSDFNERPTVPIIVDTKTGLGVTNDHFWIPQQLDTAWKAYQKKDAPDLYPAAFRPDIDELNLFIFNRVNNGVYDLGFARTQEAYEAAYDRLFQALDYLENRLSENRFLFGDFVTDSDVRLYPTLARFDVVYNTVFRANRNRIADYHNLWGYARDLYHIPEFKETTYFDKYKIHYQTSPHLRSLEGNVYGLVAKGPDTSGWELPSGREYLSRNPGQKFLIESKEEEKLCR
jgi:glutathionyl-hydroquinone reductase